MYICLTDFTSKCKIKHVTNAKVQTEVCYKVQCTTLLPSQVTTELTNFDTNKQHTCTAAHCVHSVQSGSMKYVDHDDGANHSDTTGDKEHLLKGR